MKTERGERFEVPTVEEIKTRSDIFLDQNKADWPTTKQEYCAFVQG